MSSEEVERLDRLMAEARAKLRAAGGETPDLDARLLIEWATGATRLDLVSQPEKLIGSAEAEKLRAALERRAGGEPVHRIMGQREFYGLPFRLSAQTLEPRPDTEALVELVIPVLEQLIARHGMAEVLDMGTGTGAIIISLLHRFEHMHGIGVDVAEGALATARINAIDNGVGERFAGLKSDWFSNVSGKFHLIVSNPPYIPQAEIAGLSREVREHDPLAALDGGPDGLDFYKALAQGVGAYLYKDGMVAVEIGAGQFQDVEALFKSTGFSLAGEANDLGGHRRAMLFGQISNTQF
ncbi:MULTISPECIES: peptide chain release factor N(5)-glutamine methyltransferase [unclassified Brucella]|uniref:peptide chain release factor N(5)-glutamine methyltransferase n=1 Tax=unclassified Brucella TaxID=2632610 RepID=UPI00132B2371|nr:peptide chain release factor N(5)-glutamine methyltransferase [Brucella sp. 191011898]MRN42029.1 peptide chain release factor N(5)-glutamine methyltransferase [Brucella sp. 09RB8913]MRN58449.1 peptide chain release factor N(5)-glutamine methyltransferase [Brucella sp. 09RB8918]CAB4325661.1 methyltransferase, HemK family protein [Brucella sp. 191011898]